MIRYGKLVHMEVRRFRYFLLGMMGLTLVVQVAALIWKTTGEVHRLRAGGAPVPFFGFDKLTFTWAVFNTQAMFALPILVSAAGLALYVFLIWYRDWLGRGTFAYRLLMLPTARRNLYLAKLTAILLFVFSLLAFQLLALPIEQGIFNLIVPAEMRMDSYFTDIIQANQAFSLLLPLSGAQFLYQYGLGVICILVAFTAVLLERSFRFWGIGYAVIYATACIAAFVVPLLTLGFDRDDAYLYPKEIFGILTAVIMVVAAASIGLGFRLLSRKITV
ncbi:hypothetical protein [Cohnella zeiphila]|uniref:Uncharacterized protein n=1 Tax=Cohnella zeiphila TaxID=2761120 RepID=A0A7X0SRI2_9BACL|nr:hypothetical protein [Cohnella zeiphila]MBB6733590.1 hypothetical protein [Cohnella zeiphila]